MPSEDNDATFKDKPVKTNVEPYHDFKETEAYHRLKDRISNGTRYVQLRGPRGSGKRYLLNKVMQDEKVTLETEGRAALTWMFERIESAEDLKTEFANLVKNLTNSSLNDRQKKDLPVDSLVKFVSSLIVKLNWVFIFPEIGVEGGKFLGKAILDALAGEDVNPKFRAYAVVRSKSDVFDSKIIDDRASLVDEVVLGFNETEAVEFLSRPAATTGEGQHEADNGAQQVAEYFGNNPLLLKLTYEYCSPRDLAYTKFLALIKDSQNEFNKFGEKFLEFKDSLPSFRSMTKFEEQDQNTIATFQVLSVFRGDAIPLNLICAVEHAVAPEGQRCSFSLQNISKHIEARAVNFLSAIKKSVPVTETTGDVNIPEYFLDVIRLPMQTDKFRQRLKLALDILTGIFNKDNRNWIDDKFLFATKSHIKAVVERAEDHLKTTFTLKNQNQDDFVILMSIVKLYEIKGQALVQTRDGGRWKETLPEALGSLKTASDFVWKIVRSYSEHGLWQFLKSDINENLLAYQTAKPVEEVARKIAESCIKAGKGIKPGIVEAYFTDRIKLRGLNLDEFATNYSETKGIALEDAKEKLASVRKAVESNSPLSKDHIHTLRATGNFLSTEKIQKTFLAAQLCGIFHTYGRQDLYLWRQMKKEDKRHLEMCKYYAELSHHIAKQVREKTGVGLLYEFITRMNSMVPRNLQNRDPNETPVDRLERFRDNYDLCKEALQDDAKYFEDGCYMATKFSQYTQLNASKYMVKAANKMLRDEDRSVLPPDVVDDCIKMCELAQSQMHLDMAPTCVIMAAKFYASIQLFDRAFKAFKDGYEMKTKDGKVFGVNHQEKQRPKLVAWTAFNLTRAVKSYFKHAGDANVDLKESRKNEAINRCEKARNLTNQTEEWKKRMEECVMELRSLNV